MKKREEKGGRSKRVVSTKERKDLWQLEENGCMKGGIEAGVRNEGEGEGVKEWEQEKWWYMVIRNCGDAGEPN